MTADNLHLLLCFSPVIILAVIAAVQMDINNFRSNRVEQILKMKAERDRRFRAVRSL